MNLVRRVTGEASGLPSCIREHIEDFLGQSLRGFDEHCRKFTSVS
jgi:hypothetical protein